MAFFVEEGGGFPAPPGSCGALTCTAAKKVVRKGLRTRLIPMPLSSAQYVCLCIMSIQSQLAPSCHGAPNCQGAVPK